MEELQRKVKEKKRQKELEVLRQKEIHDSLTACRTALVKITVYGKGAHAHDQMWHACGAVVRLHRKDVPRMTLPHGKHTDGVVLLTSRKAVPNRFTGNHVQVTYYDAEQVRVREERSEATS